MTRLRFAALLILAGALVAPASRVAAQQGEATGGIGIRLTEAPSDRRGDPRALVYIVDHLAPGAEIDRGVEISNGTDQSVELELYAVPADLEDGRFVPREGRATSPIVEWTRMEPASLSLEPGARAPARIIIEVPEDASDGEFYGVALVSLPPQGDDSVRVAARVGIRLYLSVGTGEEPLSDFSVDSLTAARDADGRPYVHTVVRNTGERALDVTGELDLSDGPGGLTAGPFTFEKGTTLAPGQEAPVRVVLDPEIPDGPWDATVTVRSGELSKVAEAVITFPSEAGDEAPAVAAQPADEAARRIAVPLATSAVVVVAAGGGALLLRRRRLLL